jgi:hypothetical protein
MSFQRYEERREKIKLLYIELLSNIEALNLMKTSSTVNISETIPLLTLDSSIITSLLTDLYSIIGKDSELIRHLFTIKRNIQIINTKTRIFHSRISIPISNVLIAIMKLLLAKGTTRFSEIKVRLGADISDGNLYSNLRGLEHGGLITSRKSIEGKTVKAYYSITPKGKDVYEQFRIAILKFLEN